MFGGFKAFRGLGFRGLWGFRGLGGLGLRVEGCINIINMNIMIIIITTMAIITITMIMKHLLL